MNCTSLMKSARISGAGSRMTKVSEISNPMPPRRMWSITRSRGAGHDGGALLQPPLLAARVLDLSQGARTRARPGRPAQNGRRRGRPWPPLPRRARESRACGAGPAPRSPRTRGTTTPVAAPAPPGTSSAATSLPLQQERDQSRLQRREGLKPGAANGLENLVL